MAEQVTLSGEKAKPQTKKDRWEGVVDTIEAPQQSTKDKFLRIEINKLWFTLYQDKFDMLTKEQVFVGTKVELEYWTAEGDFGRTYKNINWIRRKEDAPASPSKTLSEILQDLLKEVIEMKKTQEATLTWVKSIINVQVRQDCPTCVTVDLSKVPEAERKEFMHSPTQLKLAKEDMVQLLSKGLVKCSYYTIAQETTLDEIAKTIKEREELAKSVDKESKQDKLTFT